MDDNAHHEGQQVAAADETNDFVEAQTMPHGEVVVVIARGVGLLVAIVAILCAFLLMMLMRLVVRRIILIYIGNYIIHYHSLCRSSNFYIFYAHSLAKTFSKT